MKILLVYPEYPVTYWGFQHALKFVSKKACFPPLGLITVAAMLPDDYEKKLVDMNVTKLKDEDILWADYVFISAMVVQKKFAKEVINRCSSLGVKTAAGGPLFTEEYDLQNIINFYSLQELLTASKVRKELGAVNNKSTQNPLNCWKSLKSAKPQSKYEIRLGLKVAKAEKIS